MKSIFLKASNFLDNLDRDREKILRISRNITRICSETIKSIHREEFNQYDKNILTIEEEIGKLRKLVNKNPGYFYKYLKTPEQEYSEALSLYSIIKKEPIPNFEELNLDGLHFILGLADVVGELRRYALDNIRNSNVKDLNNILEKMDEIYSYLFSLDYPSGLTQDLRHKTDVARRLIEKTRGDVSLSVQMDELSKLLKKK